MKLISNRINIKLVLAIVLIQFILISYTFPLGGLFSDEPLSYIDGPVHWYRITALRDLVNSGSINGYDPYFSAGEEAGLSSNPAAKLPALAAVALPASINTAIIWKVYSFVSGLLAAACIPVALGILRAGNRETIVGSIMALCLWWASVFHWYHTAGMVSFVLVVFLSVPFVTLVIENLKSNSKLSGGVTLGVTGGIGFFIHPLFFLPVVTGTISYLITSLKTVRSVVTYKVLLTASLVAVILNYTWIYRLLIEPYITSSVVLPSELANAGNHQSIVDIFMIPMELVGYWEGNYQGSKTYILLFVGALYYLWLYRKGKLTNSATPFVMAGFILIVYASVGGTSDVAATMTQPNRFAPAGYLFLCIPSAYSLAHLCGLVTQNIKSKSISLPIMMSFGVVAILFAININEVRRELSYKDIGHYGAIPPEVNRLGDYSTAILEFLKRETTKEARVLFETSGGRIHDKGHLAEYYAYTSDREFIGGPYRYHVYSSFEDGYLFGRRIEEFEGNELSEELERYNIGWAIVHTKEAREVLSNMPNVTLVKQYGALEYYEVKGNRTWFLKGVGEVAGRQIGELRLMNLSGDEVLLKYHYLDDLVTIPPANVAPVYLGKDPVPFIKILDPPADLTIKIN